MTQSSRSQQFAELSQDPSVMDQAVRGINYAIVAAHGAALRAGWHIDIETGESRGRNMGESLCLIHSEISEAMEGHRKNLMDDKLPHRQMVEVELADAIIRIFDLAGWYGFDLAGAFEEKMNFNAVREDHKIENRRLANGKKY